MILNKQDLLEITGGNVSATLVNAIARAVAEFLDLGRTIGSAIRRAASGQICSLK